MSLLFSGYIELARALTDHFALICDLAERFTGYDRRVARSIIFAPAWYLSRTDYTRESSDAARRHCEAV